MDQANYRIAVDLGNDFKEAVINIYHVGTAMLETAN